MKTASDATRLALFRAMVLGRVTDERMAALYRQGRIPGGSVFLGKGQEAFSAAGALQLRQPTPTDLGDVFAPLIRDSAGRHAFGESVLDAVRTNLGRITGPMRGREGNVHRGRLEQGQLPMISHLGSTLGVLCGMLMARRLQGTLADTIALGSIGDGGMNTGACHEALNVAAVERLPLVLMVADNQLSYSTFSDRTYACRSLLDRAAGYGFTGHACDGTDADDCWRTLSTAVEAARSGGGPQMVVGTLLRLAGHGEHDDASYVGETLRCRFGDCIALYEQRLVDAGLLVDPAGVWDAARAEVNAAIELALAEPEPDARHDHGAALSVADYRTWMPS